MKLRTLKATLAMASLGLLCVGFVTAAQAQGCSASQVAGKWAFWTNGTVNGLGPRVSAGIFTLDTSGGVLHGKATSSLTGVGVASELFSGTYSVNPDCSGELTVDITDTSGNKLFTVSAATYFDAGGQEMRAIFTSIVAPNGAALTSEIVLEARKIGER